MTCTAWRQLAENVAESLDKGARVIVAGRLAQRSYDPEDGGKRTVYEVQADDIGASLRAAPAKATRAGQARAEGNGGDRRQPLAPASPVLTAQGGARPSAGAAPGNQPGRGTGPPPAPAGRVIPATRGGPRCLPAEARKQTPTTSPSPTP